MSATCLVRERRVVLLQDARGVQVRRRQRCQKGAHARVNCGLRAFRRWEPSRARSQMVEYASPVCEKVESSTPVMRTPRAAHEGTLPSDGDAFQLAMGN